MLIHMKKFFLLFTACLLLFASGCTTEESQKETAAAFLKRVYTVPSEGFVRAAAMIGDDTADLDAYTAAVLTELQTIGEGLADGESLKSLNSKLCLNIMGLHLDAIEAGETYTVNRVELTESGEKNYRYQVTLTVSGKEEQKTYIGSLQFNDQGYIDYLTVEHPLD